jgi:hypothetical protein
MAGPRRPHRQARIGGREADAFGCGQQRIDGLISAAIMYGRAGGLRCVEIDLPGFGQSPITELRE